MHNDKLLTPDDVSNILSVSKHTLAVWRSSGRYDLPFIKAGRLIRYRQSDINRFLEKQCCQSTGVAHSESSNDQN
jgi:excisionase family DNA binding protein